MAKKDLENMNKSELIKAFKEQQLALSRATTKKSELFSELFCKSNSERERMKISSLNEFKTFVELDEELLKLFKERATTSDKMLNSKEFHALARELLLR